MWKMCRHVNQSGPKDGICSSKFDVTEYDKKLCNRFSVMKRVVTQNTANTGINRDKAQLPSLEEAVLLLCCQDHWQLLCILCDVWYVFMFVKISQYNPSSKPSLLLLATMMKLKLKHQSSKDPRTGQSSTNGSSSCFNRKMSSKSCAVIESLISQ